jgi:Kef-type K+ transport system membrane component KefB
MSIMLFVALGGYLLASRLRQPSVVGQIILGVIIGPSVLNWLDYSTFVSNIAQLGATILLFVVGLEFKLHQLVKARYALIGLFGVIAPWTGGYFLAVAFDFEPSRAMIIGVALTATSIAITADVFRELGKLESAVAQAIIGAAVIDDVLALLALAVATQVGSGAFEVAPLLITLLKAVVFLGAGAFVGARYVTKVVYRLDESALTKRYPEVVFVFAMMMAFLYSILAEYMGLSAVIGAFLAGVSLEGVNLRFGRSFHQGSDFLRIVFGALFFVSLGILVDVTTFTAELLVFCVSLTAVAVVTKLIGCGLPALLSGMNVRDSLTVGIGMAPRGEIAMVIAVIALEAGIIAQPSYVALVVMSLLTTIIVPLALRNWIFRDPRPVGST